MSDRRFREGGHEGCELTSWPLAGSMPAEWQVGDLPSLDAAPSAWSTDLLRRVPETDRREWRSGGVEDGPELP